MSFYESAISQTVDLGDDMSEDLVIVSTTKNCLGDCLCLHCFPDHHLVVHVRGKDVILYVSLLVLIVGSYLRVSQETVPGSK